MATQGIDPFYKIWTIGYRFQEGVFSCRENLITKIHLRGLKAF